MSVFLSGHELLILVGSDLDLNLRTPYLLNLVNISEVVQCTYIHYLTTVVYWCLTVGVVDDNNNDADVDDNDVVDGDNDADYDYDDVITDLYWISLQQAVYDRSPVEKWTSIQTDNAVSFGKNGRGRFRSALI